MQSAAPSPDTGPESGNATSYASADRSGNTGAYADSPDMMNGGQAASPTERTLSAPGPESAAGTPQQAAHAPYPGAQGTLPEMPAQATPAMPSSSGSSYADSADSMRASHSTAESESGYRATQQGPHPRSME
ncbi:MAG: hypothetical protein CSA22_10175 [Deltaproteobacteria bacterium]|nr:MAG: hypothetical protein CSA22_10175 [Deltaproteobacteria bacterium]